MMHRRSSILLFLTLTLLPACGIEPALKDTFEKTVTVTGPARLEVENGSGQVEIRRGDNGVIHVEGIYEVQDWFWEDPKQVSREIQESPPVEQSGNIVRVGKNRFRWNVRFHYKLTVPAETEVRVESGSGMVDVQGVRGPARLRSGSGRVIAADIGGDVQASSGSGSIQLQRIEGGVRAQSGSGRIQIEEPGGAVRLGTGSGGIEVLRPAGSVHAETGSGRLTIAGARNDVRVEAGSGSVTIDGDPGPRAYWEIKTRSGRVQLDLPDGANFTFTAGTRSGRIATELPISVSEKTRRSLRGQAGNGQARIRVDTTSGGITIR